MNIFRQKPPIAPELVFSTATKKPYKKGPSENEKTGIETFQKKNTRNSDRIGNEIMGDFKRLSKGAMGSRF